MEQITATISEQFYEYDKRGVKPFVRYSTATGKFSIECYRKKTEKESKGEKDWEMIYCSRMGTSFYSRQEAEIKVLEFAEEICKEFNF